MFLAIRKVNWTQQVPSIVHSGQQIQKNSAIFGAVFLLSVWEKFQKPWFCNSMWGSLN